MKHLLVCVDFSPVTARVVREATRLAGALGARVTLLHVAAPEPDFVGYGPGPDSVRANVARELRSEHTQLQALAEELRAAGVDATPLMIQGPSAEKILAQAERLQASYLVLGSHGHSALHDLVVGSVAHAVLKAARIPVLVVPEEP